MSRLPDVKDEMSPPDFELEDNSEDAEKYVLLTLGYRQLGYLDDILDLAKAHGLVGYSGVAGEPISFDE